MSTWLLRTSFRNAAARGVVGWIGLVELGLDREIRRIANDLMAFHALIEKSAARLDHREWLPRARSRDPAPVAVELRILKLRAKNYLERDSNRTPYPTPQRL